MGITFVAFGMIGLLIGNALFHSPVHSVAQAYPAAQTVVPVSVDAQSPLADVLLLMLRSPDTWSNFRMEGEDVAGDSVIYHTLTVLQPDDNHAYRVSLTYGFNEDDQPYQHIADGKVLRSWHTGLKVAAEKEFQVRGAALPATLPQTNDENHPIRPHPMDGALHSSFTELMFPTGLAQSLALDTYQGRVSIQGKEVIAGRKTVKIQRFYETGQGEHFWIDAQTGVILKREVYSVNQDGQLLLSETIEVTDIVFDDPEVEAPALKPVGRDFKLLNFLEYDQLINQEWNRHFLGVNHEPLYCFLCKHGYIKEKRTSPAGCVGNVG